MTLLQRCPCQSQDIQYESCCKRYHLGELAPTALTLMRSRYSAYVLGLEAYLLKTWHPSTRPKRIFETGELQAGSNQIRWQGLEILGFEELSQEEARVEFIARFAQRAKMGRLHELSYFVCEGGQWLYVEGKIKS